MTFSILALVAARDSHIKPDSEAGSWYQSRYGKFHVVIYLSHILHLLFSSIDFNIAEKIFELIDCENKSLRKLPLFQKRYQAMSICTMTLESVCKIYPRR